MVLNKFIFRMRSYINEIFESLKIRYEFIIIIQDLSDNVCIGPISLDLFILIKPLAIEFIRITWNKYLKFFMNKERILRH